MTARAPRRKMDHTAAQVAAADPTQSVWVSANAGTGKTHVLIERILRLLLAGTAPGRILCLTFTKAAAAEVATRLSDRLGHWAALGPAALAKDLKGLLGRPPGDDETARARALFATTLEAPEGIRVRTVHSFAESLLGRFPVEAGIAPHFAVIDERRAAEIRTEARDPLLTGDAPRAVTKALRHLAGLVDQDQFARVMKELDAKRGPFARLINEHGGHTGVMAQVRAALGLGLAETAEVVLAAAAAGGAFERDGLIRAAAALDEGTKGDQARASEIRAWLALDADGRARAFVDAYAPVFVTQQGEARASLITKNADAADPGAAHVLAAEQERVLAVLRRLKAAAMAAATESLLIVGEALLAGYEDLKARRALLDYDDLIENARRLLARAGGISWVHYKLDGGLDHILVDEAQDTSPDQWDVIAGLAGEFFTGLGAGDQDRALGRTVFAVGDEKQSIYSFQGADPARFGLMRGHFQAEAGTVGARLPEVELAVSYRSTQAVLGVVDAVFGQDIAADGLTWGGKKIQHHTNRRGQGGLVELWPALSPEDVPDRSLWDAPLDQMAPESPPARLAERIAARIEAMWRGREMLDSAGRPIEPGDVMILVRTRRQFADEMVRALERRNIPVTGRDRLKLLDHLAVMDLVAAGRFALLPEDDLNTATVLKGPFVELGEDALFALAHGRGATLWRALRDWRGDDDAFAAAHDRLAGLLAAADAKPPYEYFADLLGPGGGRRALVRHLGAEAAEPIDEFLGLALDFERDHEPSLEGFLHWLGTGDVEIKREMERGRNEVRVLTVHGAKGLEAPIVFLPDTCSLQGAQLDPRLHWRVDDDGKGFALWRMSKADEEPVSAALHEDARAEQMREHRRLLYVALTRARDRLYVAGFEGKNERPKGCWYDLVAPAIETMGEKVVLEPGDVAWRVESKQTARPDGRDSEEAVRPAPEAPPAWALAPPAPEPEPSEPLAPSAPSGDDAGPPVSSPLGDDGGRRFKRGLLVHRLLQGLPGVAPPAPAAPAQAYLGRRVHGLDADEAEAIARETLAVMEAPAFAHLFQPGSLAEVPVTGAVETRGGLRVLSGQIDRLVITGDGVTVVDYKTNRPPPEDEKDVDPRYLRQMAAYRAALRRVYPDRAVKAVLVWTSGPRAMTLSDALLDAHAP